MGRVGNKVEGELVGPAVGDCSNEGAEVGIIDGTEVAVGLREGKM